MVGEAGAARTSAAITAHTTPRPAEEINPVDI
jgi:hypothetical protein